MSRAGTVVLHPTHRVRELVEALCKGKGKGVNKKDALGEQRHTSDAGKRCPWRTPVDTAARREHAGMAWVPFVALVPGGLTKRSIEGSPTRSKLAKQTVLWL